MEHYFLYHSEKVMGGKYQPSKDGIGEFSSDRNLENAIGNRAWIIEGKLPQPGIKNMRYFLRGFFTVEKIELDPDYDPDYPDYSKYKFTVSGPVNYFERPVLLYDNYKWFKDLKGYISVSGAFNHITKGNVIAGLLELEIAEKQSAGSTAATLPSSERPAPALDDPLTAEEGNPKLVTHRKRERDPKIVRAKKEDVLRRTGRLACEACGFDFASVYGEIGEGLCETHHRKALASASGKVTTTLVDLAIVCSNCHRIIHRSEPMLSPEGLSRLISSVRDSKD